MHALLQESRTLSLPSEDDIWDRTEAALEGERSPVLVGRSLGVRLGALTEWERRSVAARLLKDVPGPLRPLWLWLLGNVLLDRGFYRVAVATFLQGALMESLDSRIKSALMVKAAIATNDGCVGGGVDQCLVVADAALRDANTDSAVDTLIHFLSAYTASRYFVFMDAVGKAADFSARAGEFGRQARPLLGVAASDAIPDLALLEARITRTRIDVEGGLSVQDILRPLAALLGSVHQPFILGSSLEHHVQFQRAAALRLEPALAADAQAAVDEACRALTGRALQDVIRDQPQTFANVNRRRLGYVLCLASEIEIDRGSPPTPLALDFLRAASLAWSDPPYPRGLARALRLEATALMRDGRRWSHASKSLSESIAHSRSGNAIASEAKAVACKVALHRALMHQDRAEHYKQRLEELKATMSACWPTHLSLDRLEHGDAAAPASAATTHRPSSRALKAARDEDLWGDDPSFLKTIALAEVAARSQAKRIFISGESGVGKTQLARLIHKLSGRGPYHEVHLGELAESGEMVASELFGHKRGAFTGASEDKEGLLEKANDGTLFVDDVANAPLAVQRALYRFLDKDEVLRLGETDPRKVNSTVIFASDRDLAAEVGAGRFLPALFNRIVTRNPIEIPPLRSRGRDTANIANHLLTTFVSSEKRIWDNTTADSRSAVFPTIRSFSAKAIEAMCQYHWPGNIRDLKNLVERIVHELVWMPENAGYVTESGQVTLGILVEVFKVPAGLEARSPSARDVAESTLHRDIPLTPSQLRRLCLENSGTFRSREVVFEHLRHAYQNYKAGPDALRRLIANNVAFRIVLDEVFGSRRSTKRIGRPRRS
jgi:transcriptional regulator with GAF, ATPase, and Fis domain